MAISTDATLQDFSELVSQPVAESRSYTSGSSGDGRNGPVDPVHQQARAEETKNLGTPVASPEVIPFEVTQDSARKISELTSDLEYESLISQRRELVQKQLETALSRDEFLRLRLIEWTIDCVESSRAGLNLDSLQQIAKTHEAIAARVSRTAEQLEAIIESEAARHRYRNTA